MTTGNLTLLPEVFPMPEVPGTLLIVDDNQVLRESLADILRLEGFTIQSAANGAAALEQMQKELPDLVLTDISMPVMDGVAFFHIVRKRPEWIHIPFIFLTAYSVKYEVASAQELIAETVLVKPVDFDHLIETIRGRLQLKQ
ncbi:MAG: response regulator [Anaerolineales bacterium]|jgi:CheY-like chemotaxis protein